jgi:hypothetical protein
MFITADSNWNRIHNSENLNYLKPLLGGMFADYLRECTHWGWVDIDTVVGDMSKLIDDLRQYHVVTYMDGVCRSSELIWRRESRSFRSRHVFFWPDS